MLVFDFRILVAASESRIVALDEVDDDAIHRVRILLGLGMLSETRIRFRAVVYR